MLLALQKNETDVGPAGKADGSGGNAGTLTLPAAALNNTANVNPAIQAIAYRYSVECKSVVQSMVQHIQKITACRKLLKAYDRKQTRTTQSVDFQAKPHVFGATESSKSSIYYCYGCATAASQFCIRILRVIAKVKNQHYFR